MLGDAKDKAGDALDYWQENVQDKGAGLIAAAGIPMPERPISFDPADDALINFGALSPKLWTDDWQKERKEKEPYRGPRPDVLTGGPKEWDRYYEDLKDSDQLSGFQKFGYDVAGDPLTYVGGYGKALTKVPGLGAVGKGITAVESAPGKAVDAALRGTGRGVKAVLPEVLTRPSVSERARQAAEGAFDTARLQGLSIDDASRIYDNTLANARSGIERGIRTQRDATKAKGGPAGAWASAQDILSNLYTKGVDVAGVRINPSAINRNLAVSALNSPQYLAGSVVEDTARALLGGGSGRRANIPEFARALQNVPGVPGELLRGGRTAAMTGTTPTTGSRVGDLLGGRAATRVTERLTDPARRGYLMDIYEQGITKGLGPDEAMQGAVTKFRKEFPTSAGEMNLDVAAKAVMPFWGYQSKRWPYMARKASEFPGLAESGREYYDSTDGGYLPINLPGGMQVAPLRGSVAAAFPGLTRDHPPYTRGLSGKIEEGQDLLGRGGFYPGSVAQLAIQGIRKLEGQPAEFGEVIPDAALAPLTALEGIGAGTDHPFVEGVSRFAGSVRDTVADDRFRQYQIAKELAVMGVEPERASPEQRAEASQRAALRGLAMVEAGNLRYRPQEEQQFKTERREAAVAAGVPEDVVRDAKGNPISTVDPLTNQPFLNAAQKRDIYEAHPEWERWRQVGEPLKRPEDRAQSDDVRAYNDVVDVIDQKAEQELRLLAEGVQQGLVSGQDFRDRRSNINQWAAASRQQALADHPGAQASFDPTEREKFYQRTGRELPGDLPEDAAARRYFEIQPQVDPQSGLMDFDAWRAQREQALAGMDPATRSYVENDYRKRRYSDPSVLAMEEAYESIQQQAAEFFAMPKYLGLSEADAQAVDEAARELEIIRMLNPGVDTETAQMLAMQSRPDLVRGILLTSIARQLRNPKREQYMDEHPALRWYLGDVSAPGLGPAAMTPRRPVPGAAGGGVASPRSRQAVPLFHRALGPLLAYGAEGGTNIAPAPGGGDPCAPYYTGTDAAGNHVYTNPCTGETFAQPPPFNPGVPLDASQVEDLRGRVSGIATGHTTTQPYTGGAPEPTDAWVDEWEREQRRRRRENPWLPGPPAGGGGDEEQG